MTRTPERWHVNIAEKTPPTGRHAAVLACASLLVALLALPACAPKERAGAAPGATAGDATTEPSTPPPGPAARPPGLPTATSANIAELNLDFSIAQGRNFISQQPAAAEAARGLIGVLLLRARNRNTFEDFDEALGVARNITARNPQDPISWLALASVQVALHEFTAARATLAKAIAAGALATDLAAQDGALDIAMGDAARALPALAAAAKQQPSYGTHSAYAIALQELRRVQQADAAYAAALASYDDVSPYAIAWLFFQRGVLWTDANPATARSHYETALTYLPNHITTNVHLAELEHAAGDTAKALTRMKRIAPLSNDPEPMGLLAELLIAAGEAEAAQPWLQKARSGYAALLKSHRRAFVDHAAEFNMGVGADPAQGLLLAEENLRNRHTRRAYGIAIDAATAAGETARACALNRAAQQAGFTFPAGACAG